MNIIPISIHYFHVRISLQFHPPPTHTQKHFHMNEQFLHPPPQPAQQNADINRIDTIKFDKREKENPQPRPLTKINGMPFQTKV